MSKLDTAPYKGVRDFYPEDMKIENYIFNTWREVAKEFNYQEYNASPLELTEIYTEKSGNEIVNEQTFTFIDRGGRSVTLRPEMTPTLARMIAAKRRSLVFPLRWYSIPNLFRYERPQKGRRREHYQLNCDLIGIDNNTEENDAEIIRIAHKIMHKFGAENKDFEVRLNYPNGSPDDLKSLIERLEKDGITNTKIDETLARGQAYYTGIVFEIFDTDAKNPRAIAGGGRYDNLLEIFGVESIPMVGFGMGDVTIRDFLEAHKLGPYA